MRRCHSGRAAHGSRRSRSAFRSIEALQITELPFAEFWKVLDQLDAEKVKVGVNWHGKNLSGYNVTVGQLRAGLQFYIEKYAKQHLLNSDT